MNIRKSILPALLMFAVVALPIPALAVQGGMTTQVLTTFVTSAALPAPATTGLYYGGCMAYLSNPISTASNSPNCPSNWVSFSCDGTYAAKDIAQMLYDQAQLSMVLGKHVWVQVDDTILANGFCTAVRLDMYTN